MKKLAYILISLLWLVSCSDEGMQSPLDSETGGKVTYTIGMNIPEVQQADSRVLGEWDMNDASNLKLQLVVFDANRFFVEAVDAEYKSNDTEQVFFSVTLSATEEKRIVHFILNSPKASSDYTFGLEQELIGQLASKDLEPAYWQCLELPDGTALYGTDADGNVTVSPHPATMARMVKVPLIRNFAKITVENKAANFTLQEYTLINVWDRGTVAPYNQTGGTGSFMDLQGRSYAEVTSAGYEGMTPSDAVLLNDEPENASFIPVSTPFYMYERRNTYDDANPTPTTFMLVKGTYDGNDYYYKIDLIYEKANSGGQMQYYNILRNFHYHVIINGVSGLGYDNPKYAADHAASNNLNHSIDIRDFTNIAATQNNRLFVSYTDTTLVNTGKVQVKYRYMTAANTYDNSLVTIEELPVDSEKDCLASFEKKGTEGDWQIVDVTFNRMPTNEEVYTNILRFVVYNTVDGVKIPHLAREVDFNLRKPMNMVVECTPRKVSASVDRQVTANILIPTGITESHDPYQLFPLEFQVEAEALSIYPDVAKNESLITLSPSEMPVRTGSSIISGVNENTFRYVRTVTIEEYNALQTKTVTVNGVSGTYKVIPCHFRTNKANSATNVYAQNKYFKLVKEGHFDNSGTIASFGDGTQYYGMGRTFTLTFTTDVPGTYSISNVEGHVSNDILSYSDPSAGLTLDTDNSTLTVSAAGTYTLTCTTRTWSDNAAVCITSLSGDDIALAMGADRNVLLVPKTTVTGTNDQNRTLNVTYENSGSAESIDTSREGPSGNRTYYIEGNIALAGIPDADTELTLSYTTTAWWVTTTYSAKITAGNLISGAGIIELKEMTD